MIFKLCALFFLITFSNCQDKFDYAKFYKFDADIFKDNMFVDNTSGFYPIPFDDKKSISANWYDFYYLTKKYVNGINKYRDYIDNLNGNIDFFYELTTDGLFGEYLFTIIQQKNNVLLLKLKEDSLHVIKISKNDLKSELDTINKLDLKSRIFYNLVYDIEFVFLKIYKNNNYTIKIIHTTGAMFNFTNEKKKFCENEYKLITIFKNIEKEYFD